MDDRRIHLYTLLPAWGWLWWVLASVPWAPTSGAQPVAAGREGEAEDHAIQAKLPWIGCPACTFETLEHVVWAADTIQLERLAWAVFDNIMGPGEMPLLSRLETYSQILGCLAGKAYKGLHIHCPACTSALFGVEVTTRSRSGGLDPRNLGRPQHYSMTRDVRKDFAGSYSTLKEKQDCAGGDESLAQVQPVDPNIHGMKWMRQHQRSYRNMQLEYWLLLRPLTDSSEESSHQLAHRILSERHWSSAVEPPTPTSMNIGYWLWENSGKDQRQLWIEAVCALQCMVEASMDRRWITERGTKVPKVSRLVDIFLNATWMRVSPDIIQQCWPAHQEDMPIQNLEHMRQSIVCRLDEAAVRCPERYQKTGCFWYD